MNTYTVRIQTSAASFINTTIKAASFSDATKQAAKLGIVVACRETK